MNDELDRRSAAEAARIRAEAAAVADTDGAWARLLVDVGDGLADDLPGTDGIDLTPAASRRRPTRRLVASAAVAVLVVGAGAVALAATRDHGRGERRISPATVDLPPATGAPTPVTGAPTPVTGAVASGDEAAQPAGAGWYVPTWVPDGYRITSASAVRREPLLGTGFGFDVWLDRSDPDHERRLQWSSSLADSPFSVAPGDAAMVRGVEASITDDDGWIDVQWFEAGRQHQVSGNLDRATMLAIVEGATVDADGATVDPATLPAGLEWIDPALSDPPAPDGPETSLWFQGPSDGASIALSVSPNAVRFSLDRELVGPTTVRREIGGVERNVETTVRTDGSDPGTFVTWYEGGYAFRVEGEGTDAGTVDAFVAGIAPADRATFLAFEQAISDRGSASPVRDQATFADGLTVSLRSPDDRAAVGGTGRHAAYLCVEGEHRSCAAADVQGDGSASWLLDIDGQKTYLEWQSGTPQDRTFVASDDPPPPGIDPVDHTRITRIEALAQQLAAGGIEITPELAAGGEGTFTRLAVPADARYLSEHHDLGWGGWLVVGEILDLAVRTTARPPGG